MNPLLKKKFEHLQRQISELEGVLQANQADVKQQHTEKEDLLQEKWRERKRLTTLNRIAEDYDALDDRNRRYEQERTQIKERLANVLRFTKALHNARRP